MGDKYSNWAQPKSNEYKGEPKVHHCGFAILVPNDNPGGNSGGSYNAMDTKGQQSNSQQWISRDSIVDKQTGSYAKTTVKQSYSSGDVFKERFTGRVGYKDEFKTTNTFKVGDKSGYYEYQLEERFRKVDYRNSSSGSNKYLSSYIIVFDGHLVIWSLNFLYRLCCFLSWNWQ